MTIMCRHKGGGLFVTATPFDKRLADEKIPVDQALMHEVRRRRSRKQSRFLFAMCRKAWENQRGSTYDSPEHVRAAAFIACGYKTTAEFDFPEGISPAEQSRMIVMAASLGSRLLASDKRPSMRTTKNGFAIDTPRSWAFDIELTHEEATELVQNVLLYLREEVCPGVDLGAMEDAVADDGE